GRLVPGHSRGQKGERRGRPRWLPRATDLPNPQFHRPQLARGGSDAARRVGIGGAEIARAKRADGRGRILSEPGEAVAATSAALRGKHRKQMTKSEIRIPK